MILKNLYNINFILLVENLYYCFIIASFSFFLYRAPTEIYSQSYDIDIDHEMYFGSRLIVGELLYTKELHDKLPLVQYLFFLPALFKSVIIFNIISITLVVAASLLLFLYLKFLFNYFELKINNSHKIITALCACSTYLSLNALLFLCHISTVASSLAMITIICILYRNNTINTTNSINKKLAYMAALFFGSFAISVRPYLFAPIISIKLFSILRNNFILENKNNKYYISKVKVIYRIVIYIINLIIFVILINIIPYLLTGKLINFYDGMRHNFQKLNPENIQEILQHQARILLQLSVHLKSQLVFIVVLYFISFIRLINDKNVPLKSRKLYIFDLITQVIINLFLIEIMVLSRHFWPHYLEMFIPFLSLGIGFAVAFTLIGSPIGSHLVSRLREYAGYIICSITLIAGMLAPYPLSHPHLLQLEVTRKVLAARAAVGLPADFLYVTNMFVHWELNEPRHGLPHASNFDHIGRGWWSSIEKTNILDFPYNRQDLCNKLKDSNIHIIFTELNSLSFECLKKYSNKYTEQNYNNIYIFEKI